MRILRRRTVDIVAVAIFVVILAVLFWPSGENGDEAESAPDGVAEEQISPTPEATPTEGPDSDDDVAECDTSESARILARFVTAFNDGDEDALRGLLPTRGGGTPSTTIFPGMDQQTLHSFRVHESGAMADTGEVLSYLQMRHDSGESWRLEEYTFSRLSRYDGEGLPELDRADVVIHRTSDDLPPHTIQGHAVIDCHEQAVVLWEFSTDNLELALPISVDDFLSAVGPYGTAEMRDLRMVISTDLREDGGSLMAWDSRRIDANSPSGNYVQSVRVSTTAGEQVVEFVYDGARWFLKQRGWQESGNLTGWLTLPLEMMLARREPTVTASLIRDHLDEIPVEGSYTITGDFEVRDSLRRAAAYFTGAENLDGVIEVEINDGNVVRTRYRLVDRDSGVSASVPDIQWIHIKRRERFEPGHFDRPDEFGEEERQYQPPASLANQVTFQGVIEHLDGVGERFELEWNGERILLTVLPSRGVSSQATFGDDWPLSWTLNRAVTDDWLIVSAGPSDSSTYPHAAVWDTGTHRFEISIDPESIDDPSAWSTSEVTAIARALTGAGE